MLHRSIRVLIAIALFACASPAHGQVFSNLFKSSIQKGIDRGMKEGGDLGLELSKLADEVPTSKKDAESILSVLRRMPIEDTKSTALVPESAISELLQNLEPDSEAFPVLINQGGKELLRIYDKLLSKKERVSKQESEVLLDVLVVLAMFGSQEGTDRVIAAARQGIGEDNFQWYSIFRWYSSDHQWQDRLYREFRKELPAGHIQNVFLSSANGVHLAGRRGVHPFDSDRGVARLKELLSERDKAFDAVIAIAFINQKYLPELLPLLDKLPDDSAKLEGAWAIAKAGNEQGFQRLVEFAGQVAFSSKAISYLEELGRDELVPAAAKEPLFHARATMADWLSHPNELGKAPEVIEVVDTRELKWPGEENAIPMWLLRYEANTEDPFDPIDKGIGLVGSMTWSFFDPKMHQLPVEDIYAIHCVWESENNGFLKEISKPTTKDTDELLAGWSNEETSELEIQHVFKMTRKFGYPRTRVAIATAKQDSESGFVVLDGPDSRFYPSNSLPKDFYATRLLQIHIGRKRLGFEERSVAPYTDTEEQVLAPTETIRIYDELIQSVMATNDPADKDKVVLKFQFLGMYFENYIEAKQLSDDKAVQAETVATYDRLFLAAQQRSESLKIPLSDFTPLVQLLESYAKAIKSNGDSAVLRDRFAQLEKSFDDDFDRLKVGRAALEVKELDIASGIFERYLEENPDQNDVRVLKELGQIRFEQGRDQEGLSLIASAIKAANANLSSSSYPEAKKRMSEEIDQLRELFLSKGGSSEQLSQ